MSSQQHPEGWGLISDDVLKFVDRRSRELDLIQWHNANWDSLEGITDPRVMARMQESVGGWAGAASEEEATSADRQVEKVLIDRILPMAYLVVRLATHTEHRLIQWPSDRVEALWEEIDWIVDNTEYMLEMPGTCLDFIEEEAAHLGFANHHGLLNATTMAHDDALLLGVFEYARLVAQ